MNEITPAKVLIVDDTQENIALLTEILQPEGYQISAAENGDRAIKIARHISPDIILLDIMMPGMDGFETCIRLKSLSITKTIPVIFISATKDMDDLVRAFSVGGADYISKPFRREEIHARIANQLKTQRLHRQLAHSELKVRSLLAEHQQQSDRLQQVVTLVIDGLLELNSSGEIQQANPAIEKLFGYSAKALISINFTCLLAEPFAHQYDNLFADIKRDPEHDFSQDKSVEIQGIRQNGSEFPMELSLIKIPTDERMYLAVIHDITLHKNKEEKLRSLSYVDPLTNLANRRYFDEHYAMIWLHEQRSKNEIAFIMIDIDFFKQFNDIYGHQAGDVCLKKVAGALKNNIKRPCDLIARIGGEEFAVILPDTSSKGTILVAEQLRNNVLSLKIPHSGSNFKAITISLGIAITTIGIKCRASSELYQMADEALYQAKQSGRNQYALF